MPGASRDIKVLNNSTLISKIANGTYLLPLQCSINRQERHIPNGLVDGICPNWPCLVHSIADTDTPKVKLFSPRQESERLDMEHAF